MPFPRLIRPHKALQGHSIISCSFNIRSNDTMSLRSCYLCGILLQLNTVLRALVTGGPLVLYDSCLSATWSKRGLCEPGCVKINIPEDHFTSSTCSLTVRQLACWSMQCCSKGGSILSYLRRWWLMQTTASWAQPGDSQSQRHEISLDCTVLYHFTASMPKCEQLMISKSKTWRNLNCPKLMISGRFR